MIPTRTEEAKSLLGLKVRMFSCNRSWGSLGSRDASPLMSKCSNCPECCMPCAGGCELSTDEAHLLLLLTIIVQNNLKYWFISHWIIFQRVWQLMSERLTEEFWFSVVSTYLSDFSKNKAQWTESLNSFILQKQQESTSTSVALQMQRHFSLGIWITSFARV